MQKKDRTDQATQTAGKENKHLLSFLLILPILYLFTLAQTPLFGDPTEYTFIAHTLGIAHPPGYAFITVVGKLWQLLIPWGTIAWRMHALSALMGTVAAFFVYGTVRTISTSRSIVPALFAALTVGTAVDHWQHAIHANSHIITAAFLAANLFYLTKWATTPTPQANRWLYAFSLTAGLGVTHHPLTVFAWPGYALFILVRWWQIGKRPSATPPVHLLTPLKMVAFALLGLSLWLYFPLRSPSAPFGPTSMNTLTGFLDHALARGLRVNLFHFGLADQWDRLLVFATLLRLQYALPTLFLSFLPLLPLRPSPKLTIPNSPSPIPHPPLLLLYTLTGGGTYLFVINSVQDVMAYLLGPFLIIGLLAGMGLDRLLTQLRDRLSLTHREMGLLLTAVFLLGPVLQISRNGPRISLRQQDDAQQYVEATFAWFADTHAGATLLNDWEHMTLFWYAQFIAQRQPDPADVQLDWVSAGTANPWLDRVFATLPGGPVYLSNYRREIVTAGFRLRPRGPFYQVVEPGEASLPPELTPTSATGEAIEVVGFGLPQTAVTAGDYLPLTLALRTPTGTADYYVPLMRIGSLEFPFTTDSHLVTPDWLPGEIIVERFDLALPHTLANGRYPLSLDLKNLSTDQVIPLNLSLGTLTVTAQPHPLATNDLLANFRQQVGLVTATARQAGNRRAAPWADPLPAHPGDTIHVTLQWASLDYASESYTIFLHLIDAANRPLVTLDYTPLGGASPTHLWFPKWLPGQRMLDPYRLTIPADLPPGNYLIEVGLYEMVGQRRLHISDPAGNLVGDRYILGSVIVR